MASDICTREKKGVEKIACRTRQCRSLQSWSPALLPGTCHLQEAQTQCVLSIAGSIASSSAFETSDYHVQAQQPGMPASAVTHPGSHFFHLGTWGFFPGGGQTEKLYISDKRKTHRGHPFQSAYRGWSIATKKCGYFKVDISLLARRRLCQSCRVACIGLDVLQRLFSLGKGASQKFPRGCRRARTFLLGGLARGGEGRLHQGGGPARDVAVRAGRGGLRGEDGVVQDGVRGRVALLRLVLCSQKGDLTPDSRGAQLEIT